MTCDLLEPSTQSPISLPQSVQHNFDLGATTHEGMKEVLSRDAIEIENAIRLCEVLDPFIEVSVGLAKCRELPEDILHSRTLVCRPGQHSAFLSNGLSQRMRELTVRPTVFCIDPL